jgi:glycosyltransferase involved in cell wall biosynthesis
MTRTVFAYTDSAAFGGAEEALAILLVGLRERGWRPTLLHLGAPGLEPLIAQVARAGIPDQAVAATPEGLAGGARALTIARLLRRERPDVFHAHLTWPFGCKWALAAACAARVPAVVATAQLFVDVPVDASRRAQVWALSRRVDRLIAVSDATRRGYHEVLRWPADRTTVIPNAVALERFARTPDRALRATLEDGSGRPIALVPARLEAQKGHDHLLAAARRLPGVRFVCVGDGSLRDTLVADARRLGVDDRVAFLGFRPDVDALLAVCDLVVLPSIYEGLPLALIEAMAAGIAVVATDVGGTSELVIDGETGLLVAVGDPVALADAVAALVGDDARRRRLAAAGRDRAHAHFSSRAMVGAVASEYERILAPAAGGAAR